MSNLNISLAQIDPLVGDITGNAELVLRTAARARDQQQADLVVFPELTLTGYPPEDLLLRPGVLALVEAAVERIRVELKDVAAIVGYPARIDGQLYNVAGIIADGRVVGHYCKQQLPNYSVFDEKRYFAAGDSPCVVPIKGHHIGITICEDIWQPEPLAQAVAAGAALIVNLNASPFHLGKQLEREAEVRHRVCECSVPVLYVNQVGGQDELLFDGGSFAMDAKGELTHRAPHCQEALVAVTIKSDGAIVPGEVAELVSDEASIYNAIRLGVRDYVHKNGFTGAVLGLSGGIDSALVAALAVDALGAENVEVVLMPSRYTADMSNEDAAEEARLLGVVQHVIPIAPAFEAFQAMLAETFAGAPMDVTEENIQARCRGILLMAISNKTGRILLTTGNKSEMAVGYATLYGDMAGGYAPIKDLFKTWVYRLSRYRNTLGEVIPERVITRPPSAELAPDQVDSDSLPDYDELDPILQRYVELDQSIDDIVAAGFNVDTVRRIADMVDINEYKRRQAPPGVRITERAFGRDRRYPITSGYRRIR